MDFPLQEIMPPDFDCVVQNVQKEDKNFDATIRANIFSEDEANWFLQEIMPCDYDYVVLNVQKEDKNFEATIRANIFSEDEANCWFSKFEDASKLNFTVARTYACGETKLIFKKDYRCHHNTRANFQSSSSRIPSAKHTNCPAFLRITVKNSKMKRSKDEHLCTHPCEIFIKHYHNHLIECADVLRHRKPNSDTENQVAKLFARGHSPASALDIIKYDLQEKYGNEYFAYAADGAVCPSLKWMYHYYYSAFKKVYGSNDGTEMIKSLHDFIDKYNDECGSVCAKCQFNENGCGLIIAICSPLMKRVHENLKSSGEIIFVDSSGSMDRHCSRVFTFLAPSVIGALPLGLLILFSESELSITNGLKIFKSILPKEAFFGQDGPKVIMTDDSASERNSLRVNFPSAKLLLCKFHILQAYWRYLLNSKNGVQQNDRPKIFGLFKRIFYCSCKVDANKMFDTLVGDETVQKYPRLIEYIERMRNRASEWVPAYFSSLITRGHSTNNLSEANFRIIKDKIMERVKAYNVVQLFDFLTTRYESYFQRKIADYLSNRSSKQTHNRYYIPEKKIENLSVKQYSEDIYLVTNIEKKTEYLVNMLLEICGCPIGAQGAACKHQLAVALKFKKHHSLLNLDNNSKDILHKILTGSCKNIPCGWYNNIQSDITAKRPEEKLDGGASCSMPTEFNNITPESDIYSVEMEEKKRVIRMKLDDMCTKLKHDIEKPELLQAVETFILNYEKMKSESMLMSSLIMFGKSQTYTGTSKKRKYINVQPTAVARRKVYLGGRKVQHCGRPPKNLRTEEHGYYKKKSEWLVPLNKRRAAPHSLTHCIENNISLSKKH